MGGSKGGTQWVRLPCGLVAPSYPSIDFPPTRELPVSPDLALNPTQHIAACVRSIRRETVPVYRLGRA
jgi:hypothetical protein